MSKTVITISGDTLTIETDAELSLGGKEEEAKPKAKTKAKAKGKSKSKEPSLLEQCEALAAKLDRKELKAVLSEFDAKKVSGVEEDDLEDLLEELKGDEGGDDKGEDGIDVEAVKKACQAFSKKNGKSEMDEVFADYEIKSVKSLDKLSSEDLEDLYAEVTSDD